MCGRVIAAAALFVALAVLPATSPGTAASSGPPRSTAMREGNEAVPPSGFLAFCRRIPEACESEPPEDTAAVVPVRWGVFAEPETIALTPQRWRELVEVNDRLNAMIRPATDQEAFGMLEYWTLPISLDGGQAGDCEDFAMEKRLALIGLGWPASALRLAAAHVPGNGRHAVLVVTTDKGDYVLDNLNQAVVAWMQTGYRWQSRQAADDPIRWVSIDPQP